MPDLPIPFPIRGISDDSAFSFQEPGTTREALNVRAIDPLTGRTRGAVRSGLDALNENALNLELRISWSSGGSGTFEVGETVTQATSGATGVVTAQTVTSVTFRVTSGVFTGETGDVPVVTGGTSGATSGTGNEAIATTSSTAKIQRLVTFTRNDDLIDYTAAARTTYDAVWSTALPSGQSCLNIDSDFQSNVYALDGNAGYVKYNSDGVEVYKVSAPAVDDSQICRAIKVDDTLEVYLAVSEGNDQRDGRIWRFTQRQPDAPDVNLRCGKDTSPLAEVAWELEVDGFVQDLDIFRGELYALTQGPREGLTRIDVYGDLFLSEPVLRRSFQAPDRSQGLSIQNDGAMYVCAPAITDGSFGQRGRPPGSESFQTRWVQWRPEDLPNFQERVWAWYDETGFEGVDDGTAPLIIPELGPLATENVGWRDRSGNGRHFIAPSEATTPPIVRDNGIAGRRALDFDGESTTYLETRTNATIAESARDIQKTMLPAYTNSKYAVVMVFRFQGESRPGAVFSQGNTADSGGSQELASERVLMSNVGSGDGTSAGWNVLGNIVSGDVTWFEEITNQTDPDGAIGTGEGDQITSDRIPRSCNVTPNSADPLPPTDKPIAFNPTQDTGTVVVSIVSDPGGSSAFRVNGRPLDIWDGEAFTTDLAEGGTRLGGDRGQFANINNFRGQIGEIIVLRDYDGGTSPVSLPTGSDGIVYPHSANPGEETETELDLLEGYLAWKWGSRQIMGETVNYPSSFFLAPPPVTEPLDRFSGVADEDAIQAKISPSGELLWVQVDADASAQGDDCIKTCEGGDVFTQGKNLLSITPDVTVAWSDQGNVLFGTPVIGDTVTGQVSGATGTIVALDETSSPGFIALVNYSGPGTVFTTTEQIEGDAPATFVIQPGLPGYTITPGGDPVFGVGDGQIAKRYEDEGDGGATETWALQGEHTNTFEYPRMDTDEHDNVYIPWAAPQDTGRTYEPISLYVVSPEDTITSGQIDNGDSLHAIQIIESGETDPGQVRRATAVSVDRNTPNYRSDLDDASEPDRAEFVYVATQNVKKVMIDSVTGANANPDTLDFSGTSPTLTGSGWENFTGATIEITSGSDVVPGVYSIASVSGEVITLNSNAAVTAATTDVGVILTYNPAEVTTLHRLRLVTKALDTSTTARREQVNLAVIEGSVKRYTATTQTLVGTGSEFDSSANYIDATVLFEQCFITDGNEYKVVRFNADTAALEITDYDAVTGGRIPKDAALITNWRGRIVMGRLASNPHEWVMSAIDDPYDWDIFPPVVNSAQAISGTASRAGQVPDIINSMVSYNDDLLFFGGDRSIFRLTGDPMSGGQMDLVTDVTGMAFGRPWTKDPEGVLYFFGSRGGVYAMVPGGAPQRITRDRIERRMQDLDLSSFYIEMFWNYRDEGMHVFVFPYDGGGTARRSWFWDKKNDAWFEDEFGNSFTTTAYNVQPTAAYVLDGDAANDRKLAIGCRDGVVRYWTENRFDDDGVAIEAKVLIGPYQMAQKNREVRIHGYSPRLATDQGGCNFEMFYSDEADRLGTTLGKGVLRPGQNKRFPARARGQYVALQLHSARAAGTNNDISARWAYEGGQVWVHDAGPIRPRSRT